MEFTGIYIDDQEQNYGEFLNVTGKDSVKFRLDIRPNEAGKLVESILKANTDIVALDYRLDDNQRSFPEATYRAGGPAQMLREEMLDRPDEDFPIILISTEENIRQLYRPDETAHNLFDAWYLKTKLPDETYTKKVGTQIVGLIKGYKTIGDVAGKAQKHLTLLNLSLDEWNELNPSALLISLRETSVTHVIARILLQNVIKRPGLLLRPIDAYARLSLAPENDNLDKAFKFLFDAGLGYEGAFSDGWPRLWRHRFEKWAHENIGDPFSSVPGNNRVDFFNTVARTEYKAARSKWSGRDDELFSFACASCQAPTELKHSVAAHDPLVPKYCERRRICFECVQTDAYLRKALLIEALLIDGEDENIAALVRSGDFPKE